MLIFMMNTKQQQPAKRNPEKDNAVSGEKEVKNIPLNYEHNRKSNKINGVPKRNTCLCQTTNVYTIANTMKIPKKLGTI